MSMQPSTQLISLLDQINASVGADFAQPVIKSLPANPFVGLRPFESEEDMLFFGRREQVIELLQHLHESRFLAVVGSSGSGKSSLIRAGLIPKLKAGFLAEEERDQWHISTMRPGESPLYNLAMTVQLARDPTASANDINKLKNAILAEGTSASIQRLSPLLLQRNLNLLLLVDQFEEIFRFGALRATAETHDEAEFVKRRDEASEFVAIILELAQHPKLPVYVVMTMRSDFLGDCDAFFGLPEAMNRSQYLVPRLTRQQRQEAIEKPILLFNERIAPRLLDRVLNDMGEEPDQLPIMQHALMRTWEEWKNAQAAEVDLKHYEAAGTMADALWKDAEKALAETAEPELTKRVFQLLTDKDEHGRRVRRPAALSEIVGVTNADREQVMSIIECFRRDNRSFLMLAQGEKENEIFVDISHESLIRQWKTLREWVDEEAESRATYLRLADAASRHQRGKEGLWGNPALALALDWRKEKRPNEAWGKRYHPEYVGAMTFLDQSRRRQRWKRFLFAGLVVLGVVLLISVGVFRQQAQVATAYREKDEQERKRVLEEAQHQQEILALKNSEQERILNATQAALMEKEKQREIADLASQEADRQRKLAEDNGRKLAEQLTVTREAKERAEELRKIADLQTEEARAQKALALKASEDLKEQLQATIRARDDAERARKTAEDAVARYTKAKEDERKATEKATVAQAQVTVVGATLNENILVSLMPEAAELARKLISKASERGITLRLIAGYRSPEQQLALYAQGRTAPGRIVTAARFGSHNTGLAFDVAVIKDDKLVFSGPEYDIVGALGQELGLIWGGANRSFPDKPHFETPGAREALRKLRGSLSPD